MAVILNQALTIAIVAKIGIDKALKGKLIIIPGVLNKSVRFFSKILPDCILEEFSFHIQRRKTGR